MHTEDSTTNEASQRHAIERILEGVPEARILVAASDFFEEAIDTVDHRTLMISTEHEEVLGVLDLVAEEQADGFNVLASTIHIVSKEDVVRISGETSLAEDSEQIGILTMDVAADDHRSFDFDESRLAHEHFLDHLAELREFILADVDG